jgi:hypothetical protein
MKDLFLLCLLVAFSCQNEQQTTLEDYLDIYYYVENSWAGETLMIIADDLDKEPYRLKRTIFGSGLPVISEQLYTIQQKSEAYFTCQSVTADEYSPAIAFSIDNDQLTFYYNGKPMKHRLFQEYYSSRESKDTE